MAADLNSKARAPSSRLLFAFLLLINCLCCSSQIIETDISVSNKYTSKYGEAGLDYPWRQDVLLVEPFLTTHFSVEGADTSKYAYTITLVLPMLDFPIILTGPDVSYTFDRIGHFSIELIVTELSTSTVVAHSVKDALSKRVRRDIRRMDVDDRKTLLNAVEVIYRTTTTQGKKKYGDSFRDIYWYVGEHLELSADSICDRMHTGEGLLTNHVAFNIMVERSAQAVNEAVNFGYWDYTVEFQKYKRDGASALVESEVFDEDMLGLLHTDTGIVSEGRWAYVAIQHVEGYENEKHFYGSQMPWKIHNVHNLQRPPYDLNPSKYLTRFKDESGYEWSKLKAPGCSTAMDLMTNYPSWFEFGGEMVFDIHINVHKMIPGSHCPGFAPLMASVGMNESSIAALAPAIKITLGKMADFELVSCPVHCDESEDEDCSCSCPDLDFWLEEENLHQTYLGTYLEYVSQGEVIPFEDTEQWVAVLRYVCHSWETDDTDDGTGSTGSSSSTSTRGGGVVVSYSSPEALVSDLTSAASAIDDPSLQCWSGDYLWTASPLDPLFWFAHFILERFYQYKAIRGFPNGEVWRDRIWPKGVNCTGMNEKDKLPWYDQYRGDESEPYSRTNAQFYKLLDPRDANNPIEYVYDSFVYPHCKAEGYPLHFIPVDGEVDNYGADAATTTTSS